LGAKVLEEVSVSFEIELVMELIATLQQTTVVYENKHFSSLFSRIKPSKL